MTALNRNWPTPSKVEVRDAIDLVKAAQGILKQVRVNNAADFAGVAIQREMVDGLERAGKQLDDDLSPFQRLADKARKEARSGGSEKVKQRLQKALDQRFLDAIDQRDRFLESTHALLNVPDTRNLVVKPWQMLSGDVGKAFAEAAEHAQGFRTTINAYFKRGDDLVGQLAHLNLPGLPDFSQAKEQITSLSDALKGGNLLQAAATMGGLGALTSGFAQGIGTQALMSRFDALDGKVSQVLENQRRMMEQLNRMEEKLDTLAVEIERNHQEVMQELKNISKDLHTLRQANSELLKQNVRLCGLFKPFAEFSSPEGRESSFQRLAPVFSKCVLEGLARYGSLEEPDLVFRLKLASNEPMKSLVDYLNTSVSQPFALTRKYAGGQDAAIALFAATPSVTADDLFWHHERLQALIAVAKLKSILLEDPLNAGTDSLRIAGSVRALIGEKKTSESEFCTDLPYQCDRKELLRELQEVLAVVAQDATERMKVADALSLDYLLDTATVVDFGDQVVKMIPYVLLHDGAGRLIRLGKDDGGVAPVQALLRENHSAASELIRESLRLTNFAIVQYSVLNGEIWLPAVIEKYGLNLLAPPNTLNTLTDEQKAEINEVRKWMEGNSRLTANTISAVLTRSLTKQGDTLVDYGLALSFADKAHLEKRFPGLLFSRTEEEITADEGKEVDGCVLTRKQTWYLRLGDSCVAMPSTDRLGRISHGEEIKSLLKVREMLVQSLASMEHTSFLSKDAQDAAYRVASDIAHGQWRRRQAVK